MKDPKQIVAIRRHGILICKDCLIDSYEYTALNSPGESADMMVRLDIVGVPASAIKQDKCGRCGSVITVD